MNIQPTISVKAYAQIKYPFDYPLRPKATARKVQRKCASGEIPAEKDGSTWAIFVDQQEQDNELIA